MRVLLRCALVLFATSSLATAEPLKVVILAGQSNMEGYGAIHAADQDGNERPGTLTWLLGQPDRAAQVAAWRDTSPAPPAPLVITASNANFGDPAAGVHKQLRLDYTLAGQHVSRTVEEGESLTLDADPATLVVDAATYGALPDGAKADVTLAVRRMIKEAGNRPRFRTRDDVFVTFGERHGALTVGFGANRELFGVELGCGEVLGNALAEPVLLIKTAWGGKSLYKDYRPPSSGGETGPTYRLLLATVKQALAAIPTEFPALAGRQPELCGLVWWQGWNDGVDPKSAVPEYEANLVNLIGDLRRDLGVPDLPIVVGELTGPWVEVGGEWGDLRRAQAAACDLAKHPALKGRVRFVPTHDFVRRESESPGGWPAHEFNNAETYYLTGRALGEGLLALLADGPRPRP